MSDFTPARDSTSAKKGGPSQHPLPDLSPNPYCSPTHFPSPAFRSRYLVNSDQTASHTSSLDRMSSPYQLHEPPILLSPATLASPQFRSPTWTGSDVSGSQDDEYEPDWTGIGRDTDEEDETRLSGAFALTGLGVSGSDWQAGGSSNGEIDEPEVLQTVDSIVTQQLSSNMPIETLNTDELVSFSGQSSPVRGFRPEHHAAQEEMEYESSNSDSWWKSSGSIVSMAREEDSTTVQASAREGIRECQASTSSVSSPSTPPFQRPCVPSAEHEHRTPSPVAPSCRTEANPSEPPLQYSEDFATLYAISSPLSPNAPPPPPSTFFLSRHPPALPQLIHHSPLIAADLFAYSNFSSTGMTASLVRPSTPPLPPEHSSFSTSKSEQVYPFPRTATDAQPLPAPSPRSASRTSSRGALQRERTASSTTTPVSPPPRTSSTSSSQFSPSPRNIEGVVPFYSKLVPISIAPSSSVAALSLPSSSLGPSLVPRDVSTPQPTSLPTSHTSSSLPSNLKNPPPFLNGPPPESLSKSRGAKPALRQKSMARPRAGRVEDGSAAATHGESEDSVTSTYESEGKKSSDDLMSRSFEEPRLRESRILSSSDFADVYGTFDHAPSAYDSEPPAQHHPSASQPTSSSPASSNVRDAAPSSMADKAQIAANVENITGIGSQASPPIPLESGSETRVDEIDESLVEKEASFVITQPPATHPDPVDTVGQGDAKTRAARFVEDLKRAAAAAAQTEDLKLPELPSSPPLPQLPASATISLTDEAILLSLSTSPTVSPAADTPSKPPQSPSRTTPARGANSTQNGRRSDSLERMVRSRPLPDVLRYSEVKQGKTAGERARFYAIKINQLAREDSGVGAWIRFARGSAAQGIGRSSPSVSPVKFRHSRDEVSSASFPSRGDGYRAQELSYGVFGSQDLSPTTLYPGVLQLARTLTPSAAAGSKSFFSLGRKNSSRTKIGLSVPPRHITSPLGINAIPLPPGSSPLGPRMPNAPRTSMDSFGSSDTTGSTPHLPNPRRGSLNVVTLSSISQVDENQLNSLRDILPQASREALAAYLVRAGHDESLAMTMYLSSERQ